MSAGGALRITAGDTGAPVSGAAVLVAGRSYVSDPAGLVAVDGPAIASSSGARIDSPGYLLRETPVGSGGLSLWPVRGEYSETYVRSLLYQASDATGRDHALNRVASDRVSIVPSRDIRENPEALAAHREAVAAINDATEGLVVFTLDERPSAPVVFYAAIDPSAADGALTSRKVRDDVILGGTIVFSEREGFAPARDVRYVAHELGHALGLEHSIEASDMMYFTVLDVSPLVFSENERLTLRLLFQRAPGNRYPDRDAAWR